MNALLSGRARTVTDALELSRGGSRNGYAAVSPEDEAAAKLSYDQNALTNHCAEGVALLDRLHAFDNVHPALSEAVQHLAALKRAVDTFIRFPSAERYRQHLLGRHVRT
jgi:hypothetical protein